MIIVKNFIEDFKKNWIYEIFNILIYVILVIGLFNHNHGLEKYYVIALFVVLAIWWVFFLIDQKRSAVHNSEFTKTVITMSDEELQEDLELVKEWLKENQGNGFTDKQKEILGKAYNQAIENIQAEISRRVN